MGVRLQRRNQHLIQVHCVAHGLNLAASQAAKDIAYCKKYHDIIHSLYKYFSNSAVRYNKLRELQQLLHGKVKQIPDGTSVCWLSVEAAVKMIFQSYDAAALALREDKDGGKAEGLYRFLATSLFVMFTALLVDVLTVIGVLSHF